jgi:hypothetical protein
MTRTPVAKFPNRAQAEPLRARLAQAGIPAEVHDELRLEKLWFACKPESGVRLEVPSDHFERAEELLLDWDAAEGALNQAIRCPECRSLRVQYPQFAHKSVIPNIIMGFLATVGRVEKHYYCEECHFSWPKAGTKPSVLRPNSAPHYFIEGVEQTALRPPVAESHRRAA